MWTRQHVAKVSLRLGRSGPGWSHKVAVSLRSRCGGPLHARSSTPPQRHDRAQQPQIPPGRSCLSPGSAEGLGQRLRQVPRKVSANDFARFRGRSRPTTSPSRGRFDGQNFRWGGAGRLTPWVPACRARGLPPPRAATITRLVCSETKHARTDCAGHDSGELVGRDLDRVSIDMRAVRGALTSHDSCAAPSPMHRCRA